MYGIPVKCKTTLQSLSSRSSLKYRPKTTEIISKYFPSFGHELFEWHTLHCD